MQVLNFVSYIELVDSISRDGPDTPICIIHYKMTKKLTQNFKKIKAIELSYLEHLADFLPIGRLKDFQKCYLKFHTI